ncbi:hypothetical protein CB1_000391017 [Camelus ferus]|nr:hypothetical protein CB1_000391017 [Camelus ferus]
MKTMNTVLTIVVDDDQNLIKQIPALPSSAVLRAELDVFLYGNQIQTFTEEQWLMGLLFCSSAVPFYTTLCLRGLSALYSVTAEVAFGIFAAGANSVMLNSHNAIKQSRYTCES